jgi:hypothetical protein
MLEVRVLWRFFFTHIQCERLARIGTLVSVDADKGLAALEQTSLQADDNELHSRSGVVPDVVGNLRNVCVIQSGIDFVEHKEWRGMIAVYRKQEGEGSHGLLPPGEMFHVPETFEGGHCIVLYAVEVWLVRVLHVKIAGKENGEFMST